MKWSWLLRGLVSDGAGKRVEEAQGRIDQKKWQEQWRRPERMEAS